MCLIIVALMLILLYALSGQIDSLVLSEILNGHKVEIAQSWELFAVLWQAGLLAFLAGVLAVLLIMKLFSGQGGNDAK
ncbi:MULTISPECIES: hypothetical protein [Thiomicrorhabdus]|uniref:Uncharacterized protein n=1 Tax=Thiomicrorhabdus heinhorstiae TaxID=2748010 RepID=A0ABS0C1F5_9GAMM|nr:MULTISPECIES: hypothetical protein [Thiomicrorhabdus]MBF6058157.1 hypothetical protein [Thiomicrorhabdus heinhorstiae]